MDIVPNEKFFFSGKVVKLYRELASSGITSWSGCGVNLQRRFMIPLKKYIPDIVKSKNKNNPNATTLPNLGTEENNVITNSFIPGRPFKVFRGLSKRNYLNIVKPPPYSWLGYISFIKTSNIPDKTTMKSSQFQVSPT